MIKSISIENFKGIGDEVKINLEPITLLFGANSAGKSTVVHALHYMIEVLERGNLNPDKTISGGQHVDLGGFLGLVHGKTGGKHRTVKLRVEFDVENVDLPTWGADYSALGLLIGVEFESLIDQFKTVAIEIAVFFNPWEEVPVVSEARVFFDGQQLCELKSSSSGRGAAITQLEEHHPSLLQSSSDITTDTVPTCLSDLIEHCNGVLSYPIVLEENLENIVRGDGFNAELLHDVSDEETAKDISRSKKLMKAISEVVSGAFMLAKDELAAFRYLGPLRDTPDRNYDPPKTKIPSRWASGLAAWDALKFRSDEFVGDVSSWLGDPERLDSGCQLERRSYYVVDKTSEIAQKVQRSTFACSATIRSSH